MRITRLTVHNFRDYSDLDFSPDAGQNIFFGRNAQGKTSLLEAIYILATTRSWRASRDSELIRWESDQTRVWAAVQREEQNDIEIEITFGRAEKKHISVNTIRQTKLADFLGQLNVVLIEPHDVDIVRAEPGMRRKFLNLEISQIQPQYCHLMSNYRRILDQRNQLLRDIQQRRSSDSLLNVLNEQLIAHGSSIIERRLRFVERIDQIGRHLHLQITEGAEELTIEYNSSVNLEGIEINASEIAERLRDGIEKKREEEIRRGVTLIGPQRDDLLFAINGIDARVYGSQGQQRTIALSLRLAELEVMEESSGEPPIVLLDDVMTDLDEERREHVFQMTKGRCQTFITAASRKAFDPKFLSGGSVYKVERGTVITEL